jgi:hypothetical protein
MENNNTNQSFIVLSSSIVNALKVRLDEIKKGVKMDKSIDELREMTKVQIKRLYKVESVN